MINWVIVSWIEDAAPQVTEAHISLLLNGGLLARHASDRGLFLFGVPDTGPLVHDLAGPSSTAHQLTESARMF